MERKESQKICGITNVFFHVELLVTTSILLLLIYNKNAKTVKTVITKVAASTMKDDIKGALPLKP
jgi:hypothetical protein